MDKLTVISSRVPVVWCVMALYVMVPGDGVQGLDQHHHHHTPLSRLNMMVDRVDSSIWDKKRILGGDGDSSTLGSDTDFDEDELTIVESEHQETHHPEDMEDYVNNAPWTRRTASAPAPAAPAAAPDLQRNILKLATENLQRVKLEGKCEVPQQRCETIRSSKHTPDTFFQPRCALLHRCSEDSGCCLTDDSVCGPEETEAVQMYFYTFGDMRAKIEVMTFVNHTRCSCQPRNVVTNCKCPRYFSPTSVDGQCICECTIGRSKCRRYKKGRRYFSPVDIQCVSSGECGKPLCEYGPFLIRQRRCAKRRERERYITTRK